MKFHRLRPGLSEAGLHSCQTRLTQRANLLFIEELQSIWPFGKNSN